MSDFWIVVCLSLAAALVFAMSTSLKHVSAGRTPEAASLRPRGLVLFIGATISQPLWWAGIACDVGGLALQILALHRGALGVVQPLLLTSLVFALLIRGRVEHRPIGVRRAMWAAVLTVCLGCFVLLAATTPAAGNPVREAPAAVAATLGVVLVAACVFLGRRVRRRAWRAAILGTAVGAIYAATAALLKSATDIGADNPLQLLSRWQLYSVIAVGAAGLVLSHLTFQAGPLNASLPATATADPLLSIVIGVTVYGETIRPGWGTDVMLAVLLVLVGFAVVQLSRSVTTPSNGPAIDAGMDRLMM